MMNREEIILSKIYEAPLMEILEMCVEGVLAASTEDLELGEEIPW
jgi:hypothetical protein